PNRWVHGCCLHAPPLSHRPRDGPWPRDPDRFFCPARKDHFCRRPCSCPAKLERSKFGKMTGGGGRPRRRATVLGVARLVIYQHSFAAAFGHDEFLSCQAGTIEVWEDDRLEPDA